MNRPSAPLVAGFAAAMLLVLAGAAGATQPAPQAPALPQATFPAASAAFPVAPAADAAAPAPVRLRMPLADYLEQHKATASAAIAPDPSDFDGVRPGQLILTTIPGDGTFICTLSFIFKDTTHSPVRYYAGTAGHCVLPATAVATAGPGANYNAAGVTVQVCTTFCYVGGELSGLIGSMQNLGTVAYARQTQASAAPFCVSGDIGNDFALITIDSARYAQVKTSMAVWGGPYGQNSLEGTGSLLVHHGNGITFGTSIPTKARAGVSLNDGVVCSFQALINVAGGDSGSAISRGGTSNLVLGGEAALGTITHAIIGAGTPSFGTTLYRSFEMASVDAGISMVLCDASTTLATC